MAELYLQTFELKPQKKKKRTVESITVPVTEIQKLKKKKNGKKEK